MTIGDRADSGKVRRLIDVHMHLLPAIDDGAASTDVTIAMIERAREIGFETLVTTPHLPGPLAGSYEERVSAAFDETRELAAGRGLEVRLGFEASLTPDLPRRLEQGEPITLGGGDAVLVDLPFAGWPHHAESTLFAVQMAGFRPVLAHPERYAEVQADPSRAARLAERGVVLQITIGSVVGLFGKSARRAALDLLRLGVVAVAATDAHSAGQRFVAVPGGLDELRQMVGQRGLDTLVDRAPRALLAGTALPDPPTLVSRGWVDRLGVAGRLSRRRDR